MEYSVKSGYWADMHDFNDGEAIPAPNGSLLLKRQIWKPDILPKIRVFMWKLVSGALPTYVQLCSRGINTDHVCQRCCLDEESINHVFFRCPHAYAIWRCSGLPTANLQSDSLEANVQSLFDLMNHPETLKDVVHLSFWLLWYIWKSRNEFLFNKRNVHPVEDIRRARMAHDEWRIQHPSKGRVVPCVQRSKEWEPPPEGWLKCNFDCSYHLAGSFAGAGWVIRDSSGKHLASGMVKLHNVSSPLQGEALSFLVAVQHVWIRGMRKVWFEGDSVQLERIVNTSVSNHSLLGNVLFDIQHWISLLPLCSLAAVNREKNSVADALAKCIVTLPAEVYSFSSPPSWLINYLYWPYSV